MPKFSFTEKKDILIPNSPLFRPPLDANGNQISGDDLIKKMSKMVESWEAKTNSPVPIQDQRFVQWIKQASKLLSDGKTSEEIFKRTIVQ